MNRGSARPHDEFDELIEADQPESTIPGPAGYLPQSAPALSARIAAELATMRHGSGESDSCVGPALRELCGVLAGDSPEEVRWKVDDRLRELSAGMPDQLRTAVVGAFAIHPSTKLMAYSERVQWIAHRLDLNDLAVRRTVADAIGHLAALAHPVPALAVTGRRSAVHRTILVVDVEHFGDRRRTNTNQVEIRRGLYRSLYSAFEAAAIPWHCCDKEDRGDGVFMLAASEVPKAAFVETLPVALAEALRRHNRTHAEPERIRLRMALHAGEISYDEYGVTAASVNHAFRLLDASAVKTALAVSPGVLALVVSSWFFDEVVWQSSAEDAATYRQVAVTVKETTSAAWISLPDNPYPRDDEALSRCRDIPTRTMAIAPRRYPPAPQPAEDADRLAAAERAELDRLRRENRELKQANEILTLSATVFTRDRHLRGH